MNWIFNIALDARTEFEKSLLQGKRNLEALFQAQLCGYHCFADGVHQVPPLLASQSHLRQAWTDGYLVAAERRCS